jgi:hypothetical protein
MAAEALTLFISVSWLFARFAMCIGIELRKALSFALGLVN